MLMTEDIRNQFPALSGTVYGRPLVYLDNAATSQRPRSVMDCWTSLVNGANANIHRAVHHLAGLATDAYEDTRRAVQAFLNASSPEEIVFTSGATAAINLVAFSFGEAFVKEGDEVLVSVAEHHSNLVPWQLLCERKKARLKVLDIRGNGALAVDTLENLLSERTKIVAISHISNVLGLINPVQELVAICHKKGIPVLVDGAQAVAHTVVDVERIGCDFYCFSGHKMYAPMGIGVLYGREAILDTLPPYQGGGEMIKDVTFERTTYNELPFRFEAGTPSVGDTLGLSAAIDFMQQAGVQAIADHEASLLDYATCRLAEIEGLRIYGTAPHKAGVISFLIGQSHPYDVGTLLDKLGIAVRTGHHCAQPVMDRYGIPGTVRASFALYNTTEEIDALVSALYRIAPMLQ